MGADRVSTGITTWVSQTVTSTATRRNITDKHEPEDAQLLLNGTLHRLKPRDIGDILPLPGQPLTTITWINEGAA